MLPYWLFCMLPYWLPCLDIFCILPYQWPCLNIFCVLLYHTLTSFVCLHITVASCVGLPVTVMHLDILCKPSHHCETSCYHLSTFMSRVCVTHPKIFRMLLYPPWCLLCGFTSCQDIFVCMLSYLTLTSFVCLQLNYRHLSCASISWLHWCTVSVRALSGYCTSLWWQLKSSSLGGFYFLLCMILKGFGDYSLTVDRFVILCTHMH